MGGKATKTPSPVIGNSAYDQWYVIIRGTNKLWEDYLAKHNDTCCSPVWIERARTGGSGGMFRVGACVREVAYYAFRIAAATHMEITDDIDWAHLWWYSDKPPRIRAVLSVPGDAAHEHDIVIEGLCHTFVPRPLMKKQLKKELERCAR